MKNIDFRTYTLDEFIMDDDFRKMVFDTHAEETIQELINRYPEKTQEINLASRIVREMEAGKFRQDSGRKEALWQQIIARRKKTIRLNFLKYAASFLLLIGLGSSVFYWSTRLQDSKTIAKTDIPTDNTVLILSSGEKIELSSMESVLQYSADGTEVFVTDSAESVRTTFDQGSNELIVPYGRRSFVTLSDGTKVWLNSGSSLVFPSRFTGGTREVSIKGEAYFQIASNDEVPFIVNTDAFLMRVYGTEFNLQAYQQEDEYNVVLVKGKVGMSNTRSFSNEVFLSPSQMASIKRDHHEFEISKIDNVEIYTAWMNGYIIFLDEDINKVLRRIARHYNIAIETRLPDNYEKIYGKLDLKNDVKRVLDGIAFISETQYEKQGDTYVFLENK